MRNIHILFLALLTALVTAGGCDTPPPAKDPLAGWKRDGAYDPIMADSIRQMTGKKDALGRIITTSPAEYEEYAKECPFGSKVVGDYESFLKQKKVDWVEKYEFYEDGTSQHAVKISVGKDGTYSTHILFFDSSGKRVRVISYDTGHYRS